MKLFLFSALLFSFASSSFAAEIYLYENYEPDSLRYTAKHISTTATPLTAAWMLTPGVAACFKGDPTDAMALIGKMVELYNFDETVRQGHAASPLAITAMESFYDPSLNANALHLELELTGIDGSRLAYPWDRIRPCSR
jgi:hypothetical protein